ncbi:cupin domain-containing protein, partial [Pandoraea sp. PE-S2R-1]|uniref:cupin domain-containing protein n=1 Tax=Pandoraea sp. PE-S2R-1 TaxID=1986994 RepID=UPI000B405757
RPFYTDALGEFDCGEWTCEPGAWRIAFGAHRQEYFSVIEGRIRISDLDGNASEFGPGDACVIPAGFEGVFEVVEPVRKHFVMFERKAQS